MYFLTKKDNTNYQLNDEEYEYILEKWDKKEYWNDLIKLRGDVFTAREIKSIQKENERQDSFQEKRRLYMENLNAKRLIPEYKELETDQYNLLSKKAEVLSNGNLGLSSEIQDAIIDNSNKMRAIAKQHGLYKPELYETEVEKMYKNKKY